MTFEELLYRKHTHTQSHPLTHSSQRKLESEIEHEKNRRPVGTDPEGGKLK